MEEDEDEEEEEDEDEEDDEEEEDDDEDEDEEEEDKDYDPNEPEIDDEEEELEEEEKLQKKVKTPKKILPKKTGKKASKNEKGNGKITTGKKTNSGNASRKYALRSKLNKNTSKSKSHNTKSKQPLKKPVSKENPRKRKTVEWRLDKTASVVKVGNNAKEYVRNRYQIGSNYAIQVGEVDFKNGGNMEVLYLLKDGVEPGEGFTVNIPMKILDGLMLGVRRIYLDSGMSDPFKMSEPEEAVSAKRKKKE